MNALQPESSKCCVRLFSPWRYLTDEAAVSLLQNGGWAFPGPGGYPTGRELVERYLLPLSNVPSLARVVRLSRRVTAVTRSRHDKMRDQGRERSAFVLSVQRPDGSTEQLFARAVIDASGTYGTPNPLGSNGVAANGEVELAAHIRYGIPDVQGAERARYLGRRVLVLGSGHSAFNVLLDLEQLRKTEPKTEIWWAFRRSEADRRLFGGGAADQLASRGELGTRARALIKNGAVRVEAGFQLEALEKTQRGILARDGARLVGPVDEIVGSTGFRPDLSLNREVRLALDSSLEAPAALAPLIDPNFHSCGTVPPHGEAQLRHPEPGFYIVGMKAYGRAPSLNALTVGHATSLAAVQTLAAVAAAWMLGERNPAFHRPVPGSIRARHQEPS